MAQLQTFGSDEMVPPHGDISLKEYVDQKFEAIHELLKVRSDDIHVIEGRLHDHQNRFMMKEDYTRLHDLLMDRVTDLEKWRENVTGRTLGITAVVAVLSGAVSAFIGHLVR